MATPIPTATPMHTQQSEKATPRTHADVSEKINIKGSVNCATVTVRDTSSGEVLSTKRVILLANI